MEQKVKLTGNLNLETFQLLAQENKLELDDHKEKSVVQNSQGGESIRGNECIYRNYMLDSGLSQFRASRIYSRRALDDREPRAFYAILLLEAKCKVGNRSSPR